MKDKFKKLFSILMSALTVLALTGTALQRPLSVSADDTEKIAVTFDANGGAYADGSTSKTVQIDKSVLINRGWDDFVRDDSNVEHPWLSGKSYAGWVTDKSYDVSYVDETQDDVRSQARSGSTEITVYAAYYTEKASRIAVTFNAGDGTFSDGSATKTANLDSNTLQRARWELALDYGKMDKEIPTSASGNAFIGWSVNANASSYDDVSSVAKDVAWQVIAGNTEITVYAVYDSDTIPVTFDTNGGTFSDGSTSKTVNMSKTLIEKEQWDTAAEQIESPTLSGKTFDGWYTTSDGTTRDVERMASIVRRTVLNGTAEITVYAVYESSLVLNLHANGGTFSDGTDIATYAMKQSDGWRKVEKNLPQPNIDGMRTFYGWSAEQSPSDPQIAANDMKNIIKSAFDSGSTSLDLYAVYEDQIKLNLHANGGTFSDGTNSASAYVGQYTGWSEAKEALPSPTNDSIGPFYAWAPEASPSNPKQADDETAQAIRPAFDNKSVEIDLYAVYEPQMQLVLNACGGIFEDGNSTKTTAIGRYTAFYSKERSLETPVRSGYKFIGWAYTADAGTDNGKTGTEDDEIISEATSKVEKDQNDASVSEIKVYAVWEQNVKVHFVTASGSFSDGSKELTVEETKYYRDERRHDGTRAEQINDFINDIERPEYGDGIFCGWAYDSKGTKKAKPADELSSFEVTLYAVWRPASGKWGTCPWTIDSNGALTIGAGTGTDTDGTSPWAEYADVITSVTATDAVVCPEDMSDLFAGFKYAESFTLTGFDTSKTTNMADMFDVLKGCFDLTDDDHARNRSTYDSRDDVSSSIVDASEESIINSNRKGMYRYEVNRAYIRKLDLSSFDTSNVTDMSWMFAGLGYGSTIPDDSDGTEAPVIGDKFNTSKVTNMQGMFAAATNTAYRFDYSKIDTSAVKDMSFMFANSVLSSADTSAFAGWNTSNVKTMKAMFRNTTADGFISSFDTSNTTDMSYMFDSFGQHNQYRDETGTASVIECENMTFETPLTFSGKFNAGSVTDMSYMFRGMNLSADADISNLSTGNVTDMQGMFYGLSVNNLTGLTNLNTSNVTDMNHMFYEFRGNASSKTIDLSKFNTAKVKNMSYMFAFNDYWSAQMNNTLESVDLSSLDLSLLETCKGMFENNTIHNITFGNQTAPKLVDMSDMFHYEEYSPETIELSQLSVPNVKYIDDMFAGCHYALKEINISNFDLSHVEVTDKHSANIGVDSCGNLETFTTPKAVPDYVTSASKLPVTMYDWDDNNKEFTDMPQGRTIHSTKKNIPVEVPTVAAVLEDDGTMHFVSIDGGVSMTADSTAPLTDSTTGFSISHGSIKASDGNTYTGYITSVYQNGKYTIPTSSTETNQPDWSYIEDFRNKVKKIVVDTDMKPVSLSHWFSYMPNLESIEGLKHIDTSSTTDFSYAFVSDPKLKTLDLTGWVMNSGTTVTKFIFDSDHVDNWTRLETIICPDKIYATLTNNDDLELNGLFHTEKDKISEADAYHKLADGNITLYRDPPFSRVEISPLYPDGSVADGMTYKSVDTTTGETVATLTGTDYSVIIPGHTYDIVPVKIPDGYMRPETIHLAVSYTDSKGFTITGLDDYSKACISNDRPNITSKTTATVSNRRSVMTSGAPSAFITIHLKKKTMFPSTGSVGTIVLTAAAASCMAVFFVLYMKNRRKRGLEK